MSRYRFVFQCKKCKKVYTEYWKYVLCDGELCAKCGSVGPLKRVIAKPKLFRLRGWEIKEGE